MPLVVILLACMIPCLAVANAASPQVQYRISFGVQSLSVTAEWPETGRDSILFTLGEWAGVEDYYRDIDSVTARLASGELLPVSRPDSSSWIVACRGRSFTLTYQVRCRKESFSGSGRSDNFRPTILPEMSFVWGASAFLIPGDNELERFLANLQVDRGPNQMAASSWDQAQQKTTGDLRDLLIIAGDYRSQSRTVAGVTIDFFMHGQFAFDDSSFISAVDRILSAQMSYFGRYPLTRQMVVLVEGTSSSSGGTVTDGVIAVYPNPEDSLRGSSSATLRLISHEHYHVWSQDLQLEETRPEGYYKWFSEGLADYYADLTLYREKLNSDSEYVNALNRTIRQYYSNPLAFTATAETLAVRFWSDPNLHRLPYNKGALVGLLLDLRIGQETSKGQSLDSYLRALMTSSDHREQGLDDSLLLVTLYHLTGQDWHHFYDSCMLGSGELPLRSALKQAGISVTDTKTELYSLGFETDSGSLTKGARIARIIPGSAGEEAGIQVGDSLAGYSYYSDDTTRVAEFKVRRNGEVLTFTYYPVVQKTIPQIVADSATILALRNTLQRQ